jgi:uncharacterized DUF497 family protein
VLEFEWDQKKAIDNEKKHGISFREAASVFGDQPAMTFSDPDHSSTEDRYITFGLSRLRKLLIVSHTARKTRIRIISARLATRRERRIYEEG